MATRRSDDFKRNAVRVFVNRGKKSVDDAAAELGVNKSLLYTWVSQYGQEKRERTHDAEPPNERPGYARAAPSTEIERLRRERDRLKEEAAALRKTIVLLGRSG